MNRYLNLGDLRGLACVAAAVAILLGSRAHGEEAPPAPVPSASPSPAPDIAERLKAIDEKLKKVTDDVDTLKRDAEDPPFKECPGFDIETGTAETDCPFYADFTTALELQQADDFGEPFPRIGFRARIKGPEIFERPWVIKPSKTPTPTTGWDVMKDALRDRFEEDPEEPVDFVLRPHAYIDIALSSIAVEEDKDEASPTVTASVSPTVEPTEVPTNGSGDMNGNGESFKLDGKRGWDMRGGVQLDLWDYRTRVRTDKYLEEKDAQDAAVETLSLAKEDLERELDAYTNWQRDELAALQSKADKPEDKAHLKAALARWERLRGANLEAEKSDSEFKKVARDEADAATEAWDDAVATLQDANEASAKAKSALAEAITSAEKASTGEKAAADKKISEAQAALLKADEARTDAEIGEAAARKNFEMILRREIAFEQYFQARARVEAYRKRYYTLYAPVITVAMVGELGARTADVDNFDLLQSHFAGGRIYYRGGDILNGMFLEVGWGVSENLPENTDKRVKFRAHIPFRYTREGTTPSKAFVRFEVDSDFRGGDDEVRLMIGNAVDINRIFGILGLAGL